MSFHECIVPCWKHPNPREATMDHVIEFKPRETSRKRRPREKAADIIPMPAPKAPQGSNKKPTKAPTLSDVLDLTWPRATD